MKPITTSSAAQVWLNALPPVLGACTAVAIEAGFNVMPVGRRGVPPIPPPSKLPPVPPIPVV
jgi:hypothetical protein